jgi:hypothetical protein
MKITIEPTEDHNRKIERQIPKVELWVCGDHHSLEEVIEHLVVPALRAFGYGVSDGQIVVNEYEMK